MKSDLDGAIKDCDAAIRIRPHFASAYLMRGIAKFEKEDYAGALKDYDLCIRLDGKIAQAYVNRGIVKHKLEDVKGAINDYDMALQLNPDIAVAWLNRGIAKESLKNPDAEQDFAMAEQLDPQFAKFRKRLNEEQEKEKDRRLYGFVLPQHKQQNTPGNNTIQANQTQGNQISSSNSQNNPSNLTAQANSQTNAASDTVTQRSANKRGPVTQKRSNRNIVVDEEGKVNETEIDKGMIQNRNVKIELQPEFSLSIFHKDSADYSRLQYYSMEIDALNHQNNNKPFLLITNKALGTGSWRTEEYHKAIEEWDKIIRSNKKSSNVYLSRGIYSELLKNYNQAIEDYTKAINNDGRNIMAYFSRGNARLKMVDYILKPGILPEQSILNIKGKKADASQKQTEEILDYEDVIKDYESVIYMNPKFIFAWFNMGNTKVKKKDYLGAIEAYSKAIELEPEYAEAYFNRGLTRIFLNDLDGGSLDLSKAGELGLVEAYNVIKRYCN